MKALVTGGNGFIGRVLVRRLLGRMSPSLIHIVDNLSNSEEDEGLADILKDDRVHFYPASVKDFDSYESYTHIFHLASPVGPAGVLNYSGKMAPMIVGDASKMAHCAIAMGAKLFDVSTSEVYGADPGEDAQREDIDKIVPSKYTMRLEYGVAKLACEVFLTNLTRVSDLRLNIIRPFNIVGVGQKGEVGFVLPRFVRQAMSGEPITVFGDGMQKRTFTSVEDLVDGVLMITEAKVSGEIFNIGNPTNICSINGLAQLVKDLTASSSEIVHVDPKTIYGKYYEEAWNKIPNIDKITSMTPWAPRTPLVEVVKQVVEVERS